MPNQDLMDKIVSLCKRRGFVFPGSEIYGGLANSWDYGPLGVELKNNIKQLWWKRFVTSRDDMVGIDAALIMNPKVWEASGHLANFNDPLVECKQCHARYRQSDILETSDVGKLNRDLPTHEERVEDLERQLQEFWLKRIQEKGCPNCGNKDTNQFTEAKQFNLMLKTFLGPAEDASNIVYFRPETAQAMFVNFKNILDTERKHLPFGIAQIGKAFRNEITPGNFIFRTREFEQMEIEYLIAPPKADADWNEHFEKWRQEMQNWMQHDLGLDNKNIHELEVPENERAHYSKRTIDFEYDFPFGRKELYGLAYRGDFDLANHQKSSGQSLEYTDPVSGKKFLPHVIEPTWGVDRSVLAVLCDAYDDSNPERTVLHLKPSLAPYKAAVFPLLKNKPELVAKAREIHQNLQKDFPVAWDDRGNVGKRYYSQDEIGTPFGITVDFQSLEDKTVTIRDRDTTKQERISIIEIKTYINNKINEQ